MATLPERIEHVSANIDVDFCVVGAFDRTLEEELAAFLEGRPFVLIVVMAIGLRDLEDVDRQLFGAGEARMLRPWRDDVDAFAEADLAVARSMTSWS